LDYAMAPTILELVVKLSPDEGMDENEASDDDMERELGWEKEKPPPWCMLAI
jgi:hypothetical protein